MTEESNESVEFTEAQQALVDKLVGDARVKARAKTEAELAAKSEKAAKDAELATMAAEKKWQELAEKNAARVAELEPLEVQARAYTELISGMLKDKVKGLGDAAKGAVEALPTTMSDAEKLEWLNKNAALFQGANGTGVGTPKRKGKSVERGTQPLARVPIKL